MKKITNDDKGITLVALITTVILMLILVSVTTYTGIDTYKNAQVNKFVTQMQLLQAKIGELTNDELNNMNFEDPTSSQLNIINSALSNGEITENTNEYKVLARDKILDSLDVEDVNYDIIVNLKTREIISTSGIEYEGRRYYTQYKLPGGQTIINNDNSVSRTVSFDLEKSLDGLNCTITIKNISITNGTLSYREENSNYWNTITNYTNVGEEYNVLVSKSDIYEFMLEDNVTKENSNNKVIDETTGEVLEIVPDTNKAFVVVTNSPKINEQLTQEQGYDYSEDSKDWAYASKDGKNYVWIPRFAYKIDATTGDTEIKFIKGNSNIATDNTYIDETEWTLSEKFNPEGKTKLTGLWVEVENETGLNIIDLINSEVESLDNI